MTEPSRSDHACNVPGCHCGVIPLRPADIQGHLQHSDSKVAIVFGNTLSTTRYWLWRARGGKL